MKKIIFTTIIILLFSLANAQTPIINFFYKHRGSIANAYYKDTDNFQDQYLGTWLYTNGSTSLKIKFEKKVMFYNKNDDKFFYEDLLIGEYQYIENGIEKVNTLNNLSLNITNPDDYNLLGISRITRARFPKCDECSVDEKRLFMFVNEPDRRQYFAPGHYFIIRKFIEGGITKLKVVFNTESGRVFVKKSNEDFTTIRTFTLPYGTYTLVKQP